MKNENNEDNSTAVQGMEKSTNVELSPKPCCCGKSKTEFCDGTHLKIENENI